VKSDEDYTRVFLECVLGRRRTHELLEADGMADTPKRMLKALREMTSGYEDPIAKGEGLTTFPAMHPDDPKKNPIVVVRGIEYASLCEHHVLPFSGEVSFAYIPSKRIVGLSKIPRLVDAYARRLQVQERLGEEIADSLNALEPIGVAAVVTGRHTCCSMRGAKSNVLMVTNALRGVFLEDAAARSEVMALLGVR
jgi:GTP cyclohydrolase I